MSYKVFSSIIFGVFFIGVSVGYVLGYYIYKNINYNYLFYLSALFMGIGCFLLIYGSNNLGYGSYTNEIINYTTEINKTLDPVMFVKELNNQESFMKNSNYKGNNPQCIICMYEFEDDNISLYIN